MSTQTLLSDQIYSAAQDRPDQAAFLTGSGSLTYRMLNHRTNQLAAALQTRGVKPGDRVAICLPSCLETPVAVYGVLKAGAAFVPIDPAAPIDRITRLLADCGVRHVITSPELRRLFVGDDRQGPPLTLVGGKASEPKEVSWDELNAYDPAFSIPAIGSDNLAYVMFTSGSTGTPKGIMHTHASAMAYVHASTATYGIRPDDVIGSTAPLHFDISTLGYLTAPFVGATTAIVPAAIAKLPASLSQLIADTGMTIFYTVPHALIQLSTNGALHQRDMTRLRWVMFGGELFPPKKLEAVMDQLPDARFSNVYGPAELNQCTYYHLPAGLRAGDMDGQLPIGRPWTGAVALVLDGDKRVPDGQIGELVVAAPTMMKGYWNNPGLNSVAFYEDPDGTRYYRTGDAVLVDENGNYVMVGRIDRQVKLRGYRVELDEVELVLSRHPDIHEVAVYPITEAGFVVEIAADVRLRASQEVNGKPPDCDDIRQYAQRCLPRYAVPGRISICGDLPKNSSGKIDRKALQAGAEQKERVS